MDYTSFLPKPFKCLVLLLGILRISFNLSAQQVVKEFYQDSLTAKDIAMLKIKYGNKKTLPNGFEQQTLLALSYFPELVDVKIIFRYKNRITPLATRPQLTSMFKCAKKRTYIVTISKKSTSFLDTITLQNLTFNAQIGVLGHELSHVSDFSTKNFGCMCRIFFGHVSKKYIDHFEFNTDQLCIDHGLGYQLLAWSINVRKNLNITSWGVPNHDTLMNKRERYMHPSTIMHIISAHARYIN